MNENNKFNIKAAGEINAIIEGRVRFLVVCAEAEPIGSDKRNEFNMCIEELLWWGKQCVACSKELNTLIKQSL